MHRPSRGHLCNLPEPWWQPVRASGSCAGSDTAQEAMTHQGMKPRAARLLQEPCCQLPLTADQCLQCSLRCINQCCEWLMLNKLKQMCGQIQGSAPMHFLGSRDTLCLPLWRSIQLCTDTSILVKEPVACRCLERCSSVTGSSLSVVRTLASNVTCAGEPFIGGRCFHNF